MSWYKYNCHTGNVTQIYLHYTRLVGHLSCIEWDKGRFSVLEKLEMIDEKPLKWGEGGLEPYLSTSPLTLARRLISISASIFHLFQEETSSIAHAVYGHRTTQSLQAGVPPSYWHQPCHYQNPIKPISFFQPHKVHISHWHVNPDLRPIHISPAHLLISLNPQSNCPFFNSSDFT